MDTCVKQRVSRCVENFRLPRYDQLPAMGLYLEQATKYIGDQLSALAGVEITAVTTREYQTEYAAHLLGRIGPIFQEEWEYYKSVDADGDGTMDYKMDDYVGKEGVA